MPSVGDPLQERLSVPECLRLLGTTGLGRLGYTEGALPAVQPVTYRVADGEVQIPAVPGSRITGALEDAIVVLEVDSFGPGQADGWAVTVVGPVRLTDGPLLLLEAVLVRGWRRSAAVSGATA